MGRALKVAEAGFGAMLYEAMIRQRNAQRAPWGTSDLAEALYVSDEPVRSWLANERLPQAEHLARIVQVLKLDAASTLAKVLETAEEIDKRAANRALAAVVRRGRVRRKG